MPFLRRYSYVFIVIFFVILGSTLALKHSISSKVNLSPIKENKLNGIPILSYHKVNLDPKIGLESRVMPADFDWEMRYLKNNGYQTVDLGAVVEHYKVGKRLPDKPIVITFDDGYADNYQYAYPILKKYGFTATVFVVTSTVGGFNDFDYKKHIQPKSKMLTWKQIKEMSANGMTIGAHTIDHVHLTKLSQDEAKWQIMGAKKLLEKELGKDIQYFSYPYGEYNQAVAKMVQESGYLAATTTLPGVIQSVNNPYLLKRICITGNFNHQKFIQEVHK